MTKSNLTHEEKLEMRDRVTRADRELANYGDDHQKALGRFLLSPSTSSTERYLKTLASVQEANAELQKAKDAMQGAGLNWYEDF